MSNAGEIFNIGYLIFKPYFCTQLRNINSLLKVHLVTVVS
jgi:hypothetical protein